VLLIDDQAIVGEAVRRMIAGEPDVELAFCQDATQAVSRAVELDPTVILQDLVMPHIDGVTLVRTLPRIEDYAWAPDGSLFMAQGNRLFRWKAGPGSTGSVTEWKPVAAFADPALQRLSRLAVSQAGDWIALVSAEPR
jgi:hypothetical protein